MDSEKSFSLRVISKQVIFGCGYRTVNGEKAFFAWHGYPNRNDDYITTSSISQNEYEEIGRQYPREISADRETAEAFRQKYVEGHLVLLEGWNKLLSETILQRESAMHLRGLSCIFPVPDIKRTTAFYVCRLGFTAVPYLNCREPHVCLYLDKCEIILLQSNTDRVRPNRELYGYGYDAYLYTDNQESLERRFVSKGVRVVRPLSETDYRNREFVIEDTDGRWLAFGLKQPAE